MAYAWALLSRAFGGGVRNPALAAGVVPARIGEAAARIALRAKAPKEKYLSMLDCIELDGGVYGCLPSGFSDSAVWRSY